MPCPVILAMIDDDSVVTDFADSSLRAESAVGELRAPQPAHEHWRVLLQGSSRPLLNADLRDLLHAYGHLSATVDLQSPPNAEIAAAAIRRIREKITGGASLVLVRGGGGSLRLLLTQACRPANTWLIGALQPATAERSFLACGPDIVPGVAIRASLVDLKPSLLAHFEVLPPPGQEVEGRPLHQIFRWAHPDFRSREEWTARIRRLTELDTTSRAGAE